MFQFSLNKTILTLIGICLLLFATAGIFFNDASIVHYFMVCVTLSFLGNTYLHKLCMATLSVLFAGLFIIYDVPLYLLGGEIVLLSYWGVLRQNDDKDYLIFFVMALSFLLHLYYVENTLVDVRQHDLSGIIYYMKQITLHGLNIFEFNPWSLYYAFHQPLHFIITGYLYKAMLWLWSSTIVAQEGLQYISLFYVSVTTYVGLSILRRFKFEKKTFFAAAILFAFNPTLILFSGYISDDAAVLFWSVLFLYFLINWFDTEKNGNMVAAAFCFGFGTLTKLSILTLVPAVTFLFCYKLYATHNRENIIKDLTLFVIIAVPLSLLWIMRNHLLYDMQFYNIPDTSPWGQNFKYLTFRERISDFSQLAQPFINAPLEADNNMWLSLIKTELFGEWNISIRYPYLLLPAQILYALTLMLKAVTIFFAVRYLFIWRSQNVLYVFFALIYFTIWGYSFKYAMDYPYICSSDYRLFAILILPEIVLLSAGIKKPINNYLFIGSIIYACLSMAIYAIGI